MSGSALWLSVLAAVAAAGLAIGWLRWLRLSPRERTFLTLRGWLARLVERRLGGYRQQVTDVDTSLRMIRSEPRRVAVIGGGLAGIGAASTLAERGYRVTLYDANDYLGGKIGAWQVQQDGTTLSVEHGFHAFFRHYYNLNAYLQRLQILPAFEAIDDYVILERDGAQMAFADVEPAPVLNLVALERAGLYRFSEIARSKAIDRMDAFLTYDPQRTFAELDEVSYRTFAEEAELPAGLRKVFTTFSRAFFSEDDRLSMAQLIKSFHFYYLSHDHGLLYDYPAEDYRSAVLAPIEAHLRAHGVTLKLGQPIRQLQHDANSGYTIDGTRFDDVVIATPAVGARKLLDSSAALAERVPALLKSLRALPRSQRYAVLRVWLDRPIRADIPVFVSTERVRVLDAVAVYEQITPEVRQWAEEHGGSVLELHCYALPDDIDDAEVAPLLMAELLDHFQELAGARTLHEVLQIRDDFTAFHCGTAAHRPATETELDTLVVAGDWVALPIPAMLMEAAFSSGLFAANALLRRDGLRCEPIYSVPLRGILAPLEDFRRRHGGRAKSQPPSSQPLSNQPSSGELLSGPRQPSTTMAGDDANAPASQPDLRDAAE